MIEHTIVLDQADRGLVPPLAGGGPFVAYLTRRVRRMLLTAGVLVTALLLLPVLQPERDDVLLSPGGSGEARAAAARTQREADNRRETVDASTARLAVLGYRACAAGSTLESEIFFAHQLGRLGSWAIPSGTYTEPVSSTAHRVHIVYRVGMWDEAGSEVEYVFLYDQATGAVASDNALGLSYLEGMRNHCERRAPV